MDTITAVLTVGNLVMIGCLALQGISHHQRILATRKDLGWMIIHTYKANAEADKRLELLERGVFRGPASISLLHPEA